MHSDGRLQSDGVWARRLIHAHDGSSEEQEARVPTNAGLGRKCTLVPQVYRAAVPPIAQQNSHIHGFFGLCLALSTPTAIGNWTHATSKQGLKASLRGVSAAELTPWQVPRRSSLSVAHAA